MNRSKQQSGSVYRVGRIRYAAAVAAMMLSASGLIGSAMDARADSPAGRDQAVIAQGIAAIPDGEAGWSVNLQTAQPDGQPAEAGEMTGFLVADQGALIVRDADGDRVALDGRSESEGSAEALFIDGEDGRYRSSAKGEASYFEIELVSGEEATDENVIGDAFDIPAGERELSMIQGDVDAGDSAIVASSEFPVLLVSTAGDMRIEQDGGVNGVLSAREAVLLAPGEQATLSGEGSSATYVAVVIGDTFEGAGPTATATQETVLPSPPMPTETPAEPTMPPAIDTDNDGLSDDDEAMYGTDPNNPDSDGDGLEDGYEVHTSGTNPAMFDTDGDGFGDGDEIFTFGLDPLSEDTDGDGVNDYLEAHDFLTDATSPDTDGDGLNDYDELYVYATDPKGIDSDGDGVSDFDEVMNGTNPNNGNEF